MNQRKHIVVYLFQYKETRKTVSSFNLLARPNPQHSILCWWINFSLSSSSFHAFRDIIWWLLLPQPLRKKQEQFNEIFDTNIIFISSNLFRIQNKPKNTEKIIKIYRSFNTLYSFFAGQIVRLDYWNKKTTFMETNIFHEYKKAK